MYAARVAEDGSGLTVFVAGDEGSGRTELLHALENELEKQRPRPMVLAGGFQDGRYVPRAQDAPPGSKVMSVLEQIVSLAEPIVPYAGLVGEVLSKSKAAQQLVQGLFGRADRPNAFELMPRLLREMCEQGPVVCLIDDADRAPAGWWSDLVVLFAQRVASDLPLLLVLAVDGPRLLGAHHDDEPDSLFVARRLTARGLAIWHPFALLTVEDLEEWTGPAAPQVLRSLLEVTGGRSAWAAQQWRDWCRRSVVVQDDVDGRWHFAPRGGERALDPLGDVLGERLRRLLGETDLRRLDRTRELLACAALEGRRFTADAIARVLRRDRDEVIDALDDTLTRDASRPDGMLTEAGSVSISDETGERHLWRYRFASELDWLTLLHHGLTDAERRTYSLALAQAMETVYGGQAYRVTLNALQSSGAWLTLASAARSCSGAPAPSSAPLKSPPIAPSDAARRKPSSPLRRRCFTPVPSRTGSCSRRLRTGSPHSKATKPKRST
jgi:AAA domain-containing protein